MPAPAAILIDRVRKAAAREGFACSTFGSTRTHDLIVLTRSGHSDSPHIYVSTGIHGDEPAGPEAKRHVAADFAHRHKPGIGSNERVEMGVQHCAAGDPL